MAQTFVALYVHIIFSTKDRRAFIEAKAEPELFAYMGGIVKNNRSRLIAANGTTDHVHLLVSLHKNFNLPELVGDIKRDSSKWIKTKGTRLFQWQDGYGAFSVGHTQIEDVKRYIANQKEHHTRQDFKDEFRGFLKKYEIPFDEEYIWR